MKIFLVLLSLIINTSMSWANIQILDFCGRYNMIMNGSKGILELISCPEDYHLKGTYRDIETNETYDVEGYSGEKILEHKIVFFIHFKKNKQRFEGYLMTKTKDAMAGYTLIDEVPVGFYAIKEIISQPRKEKTKREDLISSKLIYDKIAHLRYILKDIRTAILVYNGQHHDKAKLGFIWDEKGQKQFAYSRSEDVVEQLLERTDRNGLTKIKGAKLENLSFGPYFHEFPINPFTSGNTLHIVDSPLAIEKIITSLKDYHWIYNLQTCEFKAGGEVVLPLDIQERREDNSLLNF